MKRILTLILSFIPLVSFAQKPYYLLMNGNLSSQGNVHTFYLKGGKIFSDRPANNLQTLNVPAVHSFLTPKAHFAKAFVLETKEDNSGASSNVLVTIGHKGECKSLASDASKIQCGNVNLVDAPAPLASSSARLLLILFNPHERNFLVTGEDVQFRQENQELKITVSDASLIQYAENAVDQPISSQKESLKALVSQWKKSNVPNTPEKPSQDNLKSFADVPPNGFVAFSIEGKEDKVELFVKLKEATSDGDSITFTATLLPNQEIKDLPSKILEWNKATKSMISVFVDGGPWSGREPVLK